jgi:hypothetical protein
VHVSFTLRIFVIKMAKMTDLPRCRIQTAFSTLSLVGRALRSITTGEMSYDVSHTAGTRTTIQ